MAKVVGLVGAASGKIGNVVYAVTNGIQVARVYQPQVYNPKSPLQNQQRAKGNLAGRMSSFVPRTALMGLGSNNRSRRGAFLSNILNKAVVTAENNEYNATINAPDVVFSKGSVSLSVVSPVFAAVTNGLSVTLTGASASVMSADMYATMQTRLVVVFYDRTTKQLEEVVTSMATKPVQGESAVTILPVDHSTGLIADIYAIPMSTADGSSVSISTDMAEKNDTEIAALLSVNRSAVTFEYGHSVLLGTATFQPQMSSGKIDENEPKKTLKK